MEKTIFKQYRFDRFKLDSKSFSLYFDNKLVEGISKKSLQVLIVLLDNPKQVVSHEEIIQMVWGETNSGIDSKNVAQYILKLRKIFAVYQPDKTFIGTGSKRGYIFEEAIIFEEEIFKTDHSKESDLNEVNEHSPSQVIIPESHYSPQNITLIKKSSRFRRIITVIALMFITIILVTYFSTNEEEKLRQIVKDSQLYESLLLYKNPLNFDENKLKEYWIDDPTDTNLDVAKIRKGVKNLIEKGIRYGNESKCEQFDFVSLEINEKGDFAIVKTIEKWFIAKYRSDGTLLENKTIGPYAVSYNLRKLNGKWLIEKSSTARAIR